MVETFDRLGIPLFVAYYRRAQPRFLKVKEILASGQLGKIRSIEYRMSTDQMLKVPDPMPWRFQPEYSGGGLLLDVGSHALDLLDFFFGALQNARGSAKSTVPGFALEDCANLSFTVGNVVGSGHWDFASEDKLDEFTFTGEKGELRFACFANIPIELEIDNAELHLEVPPLAHVQQPLIQSVVDDLLGRGQKCPSTGISALRTQEMMDVILKDFYGGREDGFWRRR